MCAKTLFIYYVFVFFCLEQTSRRQLVRELGNGLSAEMSFFYKNLTHHLKYICCKCTTHTSCSLYSFKYDIWSQKCVTRTQVVILSSFLRDSTRCFCQGSVLNLSSKLSFIHISSFTTLTATGKGILKVSEM